MIYKSNSKAPFFCAPVVPSTVACRTNGRPAPDKFLPAKAAL